MAVGEVVSTRREGDVTVVAVDRPPANAMDPTTLRAIISAVQEVASDPPRALLLTGREGFFSAGLDLKVLPTLDEAGQRDMVIGVNDLFVTVYGLPFPVVAAVTGHAIAGGFILALCADVRIGSTRGRYGVTEIKVGVPYPAAAIGVVRAELSPPAARYLALSAALVDADWCLRHGVLDEVLEGNAVFERALEVARELAQMPAAPYARTKFDLRAKNLAEIKAAADADPLLQSWVDEEGRVAARDALSGRS